MARFPSDLKKISSHRIVKDFGKQLNTYESRVRDLVKELNVSGGQARKRSRKQVDRVSKLVKKARKDVEKKVVDLVNKETRIINKLLKSRVNELVKTLRNFSEDKAPSKSSPKRKTKRKGKTTKSRAKSKAKKRTKRAAISVISPTGSVSVAPANPQAPTLNI